MDDAVGELRGLLGDERVVVDGEVIARHCRDWTGRWSGDAAAVVRPRATADVATTVAWARRHGVALVPQGGNTGLVGGGVPRGHAVVVSTTGMSDIEDIDEIAGQVTASAGASLAEVQATAAAAGWRYAVDFSARDSATVGGMIATNAGGVRVFRFGATRQQLLGVEAVIGTGATISRLGGLVKDNTGYDLAGLLCGSEGTLGIVCRARLQLIPGAEHVVTVQIGMGDLHDAVRLVSALRRSIPALEAAEVVLRAGVELVQTAFGVSTAVDSRWPVVVVLEAAGPVDPTTELAAVIGEFAPDAEVAVATDDRGRAELWAVRERHTEAVATAGHVLKFDVTIPVGQLAAFAADAEFTVEALGLDARTWIFGHLADGNLHVNVTTGSGAEPGDAQTRTVTEAVLGLVLDRSGSISAEHGVGRAKVGWLERSRGAGDVGAMRVVKDAFDPDGICNPGVLLPALA